MFPCNLTNEKLPYIPIMFPIYPHIYISLYIYIPIYILFSVHLKQGEQKVNIFGGINLQYNIDSFWKNGSLGPYFDISERREFFEKVQVKQGEQK